MAASNSMNEAETGTEVVSLASTLPGKKTFPKVKNTFPVSS